MKSLVFDIGGERRVRRARFVSRSNLPVGAACVVAAGVRETLASIFGVTVTARLLEPVIPSAPAWVEIARGATMYRLRGSVADAAIVLRRDDAVALASAAFGERTTVGLQRELSPLENDVLERTIVAVAGALNAVCGARDHDVPERVASLSGFTTYFEIVLEHSVDARIGVALSRDPMPEPHGKLEIADISDVRLTPALHVELRAMEGAALACMPVGTIVPVASWNGIRGRLCAGGIVLAGGTCGVRNGRFALTVDAPS